MNKLWENLSPPFQKCDNSKSIVCTKLAKIHISMGRSSSMETFRALKQLYSNIQNKGKTNKKVHLL